MVDYRCRALKISLGVKGADILLVLPLGGLLNLGHASWTDRLWQVFPQASCLGGR